MTTSPASSPASSISTEVFASIFAAAAAVPVATTVAASPVVKPLRVRSSGKKGQKKGQQQAPQQTAPVAPSIPGITAPQAQSCLVEAIATVVKATYPTLSPEKHQEAVGAVCHLLSVCKLDPVPAYINSYAPVADFVKGKLVSVTQAATPVVQQQVSSQVVVAPVLGYYHQFNSNGENTKYLPAQYHILASNETPVKSASVVIVVEHWAATDKYPSPSIKVKALPVVVRQLPDNRIGGLMMSGQYKTLHEVSIKSIDDGPKAVAAMKVLLEISGKWAQ